MIQLERAEKQVLDRRREGPLTPSNPDKTLFELDLRARGESKLRR